MRSVSDYFGLGATNIKLAQALNRLGLKKPKGHLHNAQTDAAAALLIDEKIRKLSNNRT
jgi:hypothetical protein